MDGSSKTPRSNLFTLLTTFFFNRVDRVQVATTWGYCPAIPKDFDDMVRAHLGETPEAEADLVVKGKPQRCRGPFRIGAYAPGVDGLTKWVCFDIDGPNHACGVDDPQDARRQVQKCLADAGLPSSAEQSQSGQGFHIWVFFSPPVPAADARRLRFLVPTNIATKGGGVADATKGVAIEVFPKHDTIRPDGFGSAMSLPFYLGKSHFYRTNAAGDLEGYEPSDFETVTPETLALAIEALPKPGVAEREAANRPRRPDVWAAWRLEATTKISLKAIYGELLTGKTAGKGWLQCRDPWSASGDTTPSASVADDVPGLERGSFHSFISTQTFNMFDFQIEHGDVDSFAAACARVSKLTGVPLPTAAPERLEIVLDDRDFREIVGDALRVIQHGNERLLRLFRRGSEIVRLATTVTGVSFEPVDFDWAFGWYSENADWRKPTKEGLKTAWPNERVIKTALTAKFPLPELESVEHTPFFDSRGRLVASRGYQRASRAFLSLPKAWRMEQVAKAPTRRDVLAAKAILEEMLCDFPFVGEADRAHALSAFLTPFVRRLIDGPTPMHLFEAPTPGTGKSLLCNLIGRVVQGSATEASVFSSSQEEQRKQITAALLRARSILLWDNVDNDDRSGRLNSRALALALTCEVWEDRVLRTSKTVQLPNRVLWLMTGNNPRFSMELARRTVRCRIDSGTEGPTHPRLFRHPEIGAWVSTNRGRLVHALLTLASAWINEGRPTGRCTLASFEAWASVVGGVLNVAGYDAFLGNLKEFYDEADAESRDWRELIDAWWNLHGTAPTAAAALVAVARDRDVLPEVWDGGTEKAQETRMGNRLRKMLGCVFDGKRIATSVDRDKQYCLRVVSVASLAATPALDEPTSAAAGTSGTSPTSGTLATAESQHGIDTTSESPVGATTAPPPFVPSAATAHDGDEVEDKWDDDELTDPDELAEFSKRLEALDNGDEDDTEVA
jgi:hypothetical protein